MENKGLRSDIQFLRGVAVLLVVIYHSGLDLFSEGYLGVDIFFVISGFLITQVILKSLDNNKFSFSGFYIRRAKRLLPALYSTLIFTTLLSVLFLTNAQWKDYLDQLIGALTFSANFVLPGQTGYFEQAAEGKPLLHIWSLSLEEQYYFLLPLFLFLLPRNYRLIGLIGLTTASLIWCFNWLYASQQEAPFLWRIGDTTKYEWAFYLLPTRAWELLFGSIIAWYSLNKSHISTPRYIKYLGLSLIIAFTCISLTPTHPSYEAIIIVLSTGLLLIGTSPWLHQNVVTRAIQRVGDWSYSIYLVHWPLFSFAHLGYFGDVPQNVQIGLILLSIFLGFLQFRFIETPFRFGKVSYIFSNWKYALLITASLASIPLLAGSHPFKGNTDFDAKRIINQGLSSACEHAFNDDGHLKAECRSSDSPKIVVWGDSYAMHLVPGLLQNNELIQITKSVCGPFPGLAIIDSVYSEQWAKRCIEYNQQALDYILQTKGIEFVVMSSPLSQYLTDKNLLLTLDGVSEISSTLLIESFSKTVNQLDSAGIKTIFVSPPPKNGKDIGECLERRFGPAVFLGKSCTITKDDYLKHQEKVIDMLEAFSRISTVFRLDEKLCNDNYCETSIGNTFLYRDKGHLSIEGSKLIFKKFIVQEAALQ